jgi:hypothetical protein
MGVVPLGYVTGARCFDIFLHEPKCTKPKCAKNDTCTWNLIAEGSRLLNRLGVFEKVWRSIDLLETIFHSIRSVNP